MPHLVFIHGIANKPEQHELLQIWRRILAREDRGDPGVRLGSSGINSSLVYWADVMYPRPDTNLSKFESGDQDAPDPAPAGVEANWHAAADKGQETDWLAAFAHHYGIDPNDPVAPDPKPALRDALERIPLPWAIKRPFMKLLARDTHHYLFNKKHQPRPGETYRVRDEIRARFVATLEKAKQDGGPLIVVAHSQGTIVTYDCLKNVPECPRIDGLITLGTPLGLDEVQDMLAPGYSRNDGFPAEKLNGYWANIYDPLDIVSRPDPDIANDFLKAGEVAVQDYQQTNRGMWRHAMAEYLSGKQVRTAVRYLFGLKQPDD